jgi:hypothetical protein
VGDGRGYLTTERADDAGGAAEGDDHERDASFREPARSRLASSASDTAPSGEVREHGGCLGQPTRGGLREGITDRRVVDIRDCGDEHGIRALELPQHRPDERIVPQLGGKGLAAGR